MKHAKATTAVFLLSAGALHAQAPFALTPDWISTDTPYSTGAALVDLDHDGWLDFVVANGNDIERERLVVYYNNGDGTLPLAPNWSSSDTEYNGHVAIADVNGDGWLDVAVGLTVNDLGTPTARLYLNNEGTLSSSPDWESPDQVAAFQVAFGDVNGDGRPDLAVGTGFPYAGSHRWHNYVYMNVGGMLEPTASWVSADVWDYGDVIFCDVNGDGWLDLVGVGEKTDTWVYVNVEGTLATTATWHTTDRPEQFALMATCGDVNEDGRTELFVTDNTQLLVGMAHRHDVDFVTDGRAAQAAAAGYVRRYDGLPGGFFTTLPAWTSFERYGSSVALADVDADDDLDLMSGGWWRSTHLFLNADGILPPIPSWSSATSSVVEAIWLGDVNKDGLRWPTDTFDATSMSPRHLFELSRQPIEGIEEILVDGVALEPNQFTFDAVHGWVSVGPTPSDSVTVRYVYTQKPDMAVTNWDDQGNFLFYNMNDAPRFGDLDDDDDVDGDDVEAFSLCHTGPGGGPLTSDCEAGDADMDDDVDCDDWIRFEQVWPGPGEVPAITQCSASVPVASSWGTLALGLVLLTAVTLVSARRRDWGRD